MYRFVSIYFDAKFEKKTELRNPCFDPA
jgi:hypothetical protein